MQSLKSPYTLYNQQSVGSTLHNNLLFITRSPFLVDYGNNIRLLCQIFSPPLCFCFMAVTSFPMLLMPDRALP